MLSNLRYHNTPCIFLQAVECVISLLTASWLHLKFGVWWQLWLMEILLSSNHFAHSHFLQIFLNIYLLIYIPTNWKKKTLIATCLHNDYLLSELSFHKMTITYWNVATPILLNCNGMLLLTWKCDCKCITISTCHFCHVMTVFGSWCEHGNPA